MNETVDLPGDGWEGEMFLEALQNQSPIELLFIAVTVLLTLNNIKIRISEISLFDVFLRQAITAINLPKS